MFFLLLFFLIISTVANPNVIKILLPKSQENQALSKKTIALTVTENKRYFLNQSEVPCNLLEQELVKQTQGLDDPTVIIRLPYNLTVQDLVDVMAIGAKHKLKMVLATDKKK
jgi:biopolymer transport protein ExbD